jgi:hypothetical protein
VSTTPLTSSFTAKLVAKLQERPWSVGRLRFWRSGRHRALRPNVRIALVECLVRLRALDACKENAGLVTRLEVLRGEHPWLESPGVPSEDQAWALADSLQAVWVQMADKAALLSEAVPGGDQPSQQTPEESLRAMVSRRVEAQQRQQAQERLRRSLRSRYLRAGGAIMAIAVLLLWIVAFVLVADRGTLTLCALAGIIGGLIASALRLRDSVAIVDVQFFHTWWWVQPAVGAAVGMFIYALLRTPILVLPGTADTNDAASRMAASIIYAFLAGFSEPWLLGVLEGLGGGTGARDGRNATAR